MLDNARDAQQIRPLLPGAQGCAVVVTSRHALTGLVAADNAHPVVLDLLTHAEAGELLAVRLGSDRIAAEPDCRRRNLDRCARLPLALVIAAARVATRPEFSLSRSSITSGEARATGLDAWTGDDAATDVRTVFSWSYKRSPGRGAAVPAAGPAPRAEPVATGRRKPRRCRAGGCPAIASGTDQHASAQRDPSRSVRISRPAARLRRRAGRHPRA